MSSPFSWDDAPELNITPLVDVMLVLMAILMITATQVSHYEEQVSLPKGSSRTKHMPKKDPLRITLDKDHYVHINQQQYRLDTIADILKQLAPKYNTQDPVAVHADGSVAYREVMGLLKSITEAGFRKASLVTQ